MSRKADMARARRDVERAAQYLADASRLLADLGYQQPSRAMHSASYEAATALCAAEAEEDRAHPSKPNGDRHE